ncbi:MAG: ABC transporter permease [Oscillospiraceae bacterium]|nr:ABC transporter permease [Oscillospiraceae bacterium]
MIKLLKCEYMKTRRRYVLLTALVVTAALLTWTLHGNYGEDFLKIAWMGFLYQMPLINAIFLSLLSIIVSSRISDIEHKGVMLKQFAAVAERGKIYDAKFIYGFAIVLLCTLISWVGLIVGGYCKGFGGDVPIKLYLLYLLFTITPTLAVYIFQHTMSLCFKNQAVTFFTGIIGTFCGVFSMFPQQFPWLRRIFIWGYYGTLQFVGLFDWTKEDKYKSAHFDVIGIDWTFFGVLLAICVVMYIIGRMIFKRKEL